uniref:Immunoglobulin V-set domain-containing protein n=1 Tax=Sinocyclocheilus anshuiensis TaxID=1608454 RepID=A0A671MCQ2_9TELE
VKLILLKCWFVVVDAITSLSVTGHSGGGIIITCTYQDKHTGNAKYFCKGPWLTCCNLIKTYEKNKWVESGRFSIAAVFTVTIRDLSEEDSGTHQCGVDIRISEDFYTEVNLNIITVTIIKKSTDFFFFFLNQSMNNSFYLNLFG